MLRKMDDSTYFANPRMSAHKLMDFEKSPKLYYEKHVLGTLKPSDSKSMGFGRLYHLCILEPYLFEQNVRVPPTVDKRTNVGKAMYNAFLECQKPTSIIADQEDYDKCLAMRSVLLNHPVAKKYFSGEGDNEQAAIFDLDLDGHEVQCKAKFDRITETHVIDLKTTQDASMKAFGITSDRYGYLLQAAFYRLAAKACGFENQKVVFIAQETEAPYEVGVYNINEAILEKEDERITNLLNKFVTAQMTKNYEPMCTEEKDLWVPPYYFERFYE